MSVTSRVATALVVSAALCAVAGAHAFVSFDGIRIKTVRTGAAPVDGIVRVSTPVPSRTNDLRPPFAVIAEIENSDSAPHAFDVRIDDVPVCTKTVAAGVTRRIDCAMTGGWQAAARHTVTVQPQGAAPTWRLEYLELATHHGGSAGFVDLRIVPAGFTQYVRPSWLALVGLFVLYAGLFLRPAPRLPRAVRIAHRVAATVALTLVALAAVLPLVSPFGLVISLRTIVNWSLLLFLPRLWVLARVAVRSGASRWRQLAVAAAPFVVALAVLGAYRAVVVHRLTIEYQGNRSGLIVIARDTFDRNPLVNGRDDLRRTLILREGGGYDGQFMYFAVFDPFLRAFHDTPERYNAVMDAPPYRYGRIGFSLLTRALNGSHWQLYPSTMTGLIVASLGLAALALALLARRFGASPAWGLLIFLVPGFFQSVQVDLPEPMAAAALLAGYWCVVSNRRWAGTALLAFSLLVRETGAVFVVCLAVEQWLGGKRREAIVMTALAALPVVAWHAYVGSVLYSGWGLRAFFLVPHDLGIPFRGFADLWTEIAHGRYYEGSADLVRAGIWYPITLTVGFAAALLLAVRRPSAVTVAALFYGFVAVSLNFEAIWVHVGNGQRGTYELFIMLALAATQAARYPRVLRLGLGTFWAVAAIYVFYGTFDASFVRDSLIYARLW